MPPGRDVASLLERCRGLRRDSTDAEGLLWQLLRDRQLGGVKFRRQHQLGPFIVDFFTVSHGLAVEIDGGQHFDDAQASADAVRTAYLEERGVRVVRFSNLEVLKETDSVLSAIWEAVGLPSP